MHYKKKLEKFTKILEKIGKIKYTFLINKNLVISNLCILQKQKLIQKFQTSYI